MVSFQQDFFEIIRTSHHSYFNKMDKLLTNDDLLETLCLEDAELLLSYTKEYTKLIKSINLVIDKINNIKKFNNIHEKIETELISKITPIMCVYRTLLLEKYKKQLDDINYSDTDFYHNSSINDID